MDKKKASKSQTDTTSDNQLRIKRLLQDLEREFDILLNENVQCKFTKSIFFKLMQIDFFLNRPNKFNL